MDKKKTVTLMVGMLLLAGGVVKAATYEWTSGTYEIGSGDNYSSDWINLRNSATVNMTGGDLGILYAYDSSKFNLHGGNVVAVLQFYGTSTADISGGTITDGFNMYDNSVVNISGGILSGSGIGMKTSSTLNLSGGDFGEYGATWIYSRGIINVYALDLNIQSYHIGPHNVASGHWADGTPFQFVLGRAQIYDPPAQIIFHEVPEPATVTFLVLGMLGIRILKR